MEKPLVSICCLTYNHEPYIRDCLEGFMMQQTNFPFEVLIHDDASTDHTADIIREYEKKYPDIIKPIYQTENQYSQGVKVDLVYNYPRAQGKYIALCEGDDFWCDPEKLQHQVDFMESHPDYSACFCGAFICNEFEKCITAVKMPLIDFPQNTYEAQVKILKWEHALYTCACLFRHDSYLSKRELILRDCHNAPMGDLQLFFHLSGAGKIKYIPRRSVVYRIHTNSVSQFDDAIRRQKFIDQRNQAIRAIAASNGYSDIIPQIISNLSRTTKPTIKSKIMSFLRPLKRMYRGDYHIYKLYIQEIKYPRRIHLINSFCNKSTHGVC